MKTRPKVWPDGMILENSKIRIHHLFMLYLPKDEHLIWVGESLARPIRLNPNHQFFKKLLLNHWRIPLVYALIYPFIPSMSHLPIAPYLFVLDLLWFACLALLLWLFLREFFIFGKEYYAISTKRLLVLRLLLWKSLDSALIGLLPEFHLDSQRDQLQSIRFAPMRTEEKKVRGRVFRIEHHRRHLEKLSREEAQTAYKLLQNSKNAILDERAREIGLMK